MSGKHIIGVSKAVAARQGTMGQFLFAGLPGKGQPIGGRLLLSFGSKWTAAGAAMGCVFSRYMALSITSNYWTPTKAANKELDMLSTRKHCGSTRAQCNRHFFFPCKAQTKTLTYSTTKNSNRIILKKFSFNNWTRRFVNH